jgi:hypothetical protein
VSVLLRQADGFECAFPLHVFAHFYCPAVAQAGDVEERGGKFDPAELSSRMQRERDENDLTFPNPPRVYYGHGGSSERLVEPGIQMPRDSISTVAHGRIGKVGRIVPNDVGMPNLAPHRGCSTFVPRRIRPSRPVQQFGGSRGQGVDLLLRHRPRSIPQSQESST